jgi:hypothetical protein
MRKIICLSLVILVGCGSEGGGSAGPQDAPTGTEDMAMVKIDAPRPVDGAVDAMPDAVIVPGNAFHYVHSSMLLPQNNTQARDYGLDLNGDNTVDNQLGMVIATFNAQGFDSQTPMTSAIDKGNVLMLGSVRASSLMMTALASFTIYQGANPMPAPCASAQDTVCRKHLAGTGTFSLEANAPIDPPLVGMIAANQLTAGPGHLTIRFTMLGSMPITVTLLGARVELTTNGTSYAGKLAGAVSQADVQTKILPPLRDGFEASVMKDCTMLTSPPMCGCPSGSTGRTMLNLFDTNQNCSISLAEVQNNSLIQALFAPDVTVESKQALSFGVWVTSVAGTFTDPM